MKQDKDAHTEVISAEELENKLPEGFKPPENSKVYRFRDGLGLINHEGKWGFINENGRGFAKYDDAWPFSEGMALVKLNGKYGFVDRSGREVVAPYYDEAKPYSEGLALVRLGRKFGYINALGKVVVPFEEV